MSASKPPKQFSSGYSQMIKIGSFSVALDSSQCSLGDNELSMHQSVSSNAPLMVQSTTNAPSSSGVATDLNQSENAVRDPLSVLSGDSVQSVQANAVNLAHSVQSIPANAVHSVYSISFAQSVCSSVNPNSDHPTTANGTLKLALKQTAPFTSLNLGSGFLVSNQENLNLCNSSNSKALYLPHCSRCLRKGHLGRECVFRIRCLICFHYGHRAKHCAFKGKLMLQWIPKGSVVTRVSPRLIWKPKIDPNGGPSSSHIDPETVASSALKQEEADRKGEADHQEVQEHQSLADRSPSISTPCP